MIPKNYEVFIIFRKLLFIMGMGFMIFQPLNSLAIELGGIINKDTTWLSANSPYLLSSTIQIPEGVTLSIEPGVVISMVTSDDMFLIHGTLHAHGTTENPIKFDGGGNSEIFVTWAGAGNASLDYCMIRNGRHLWYRGGHFELRHSYIENLSEGVSLESPSDDTFIEYNSFMNSAGISVYQAKGNSCNTYIQHNLFQNSLSAIHNSGGSPGVNNMIVKYNSFINIPDIMLSLAENSTSAVMDGTENYWPKTDVAFIDSAIYDSKDDIRCKNFIDYLPILTEPHPNTPVPSHNIMPMAVAGPDLVVFDQVTLDGGDSSDSDGEIVSWQWSLTHRSNSYYNRTVQGKNPTMINLAPGLYDVILTVKDDGGDIAIDRMLLGVAGQWDIDEDKKLGLSECIYILKILSGK